MVRVAKILEDDGDINDSHLLMMSDLMSRTKVSFVRFLYNLKSNIGKERFQLKMLDLKFFRFKQYLHSNKIEKTMRRPPRIPVISTMNARLL